MNKKALSLSINILTILIISLVVLGLAVGILNQFIGRSRKVSTEISTQIEQEIQNLFAQTTQKVIVPEYRKELRRGKTYVFGLGIKNYLEENSNFRVQMSFSEAIGTKTRESYENYVADPSEWILENQGPYNLAPNGNQIVSLPITVKEGEKGITYVFDVEVTCDGPDVLCNPYGYPQKIYIDVID